MPLVIRQGRELGMADVPGRLSGAMQSAGNVLTLFGAAFYVLSAKRRKSPAT